MQAALCNALRLTFPTVDNLVGADFSKCALSRARFTGANLYAAKFVKAAGEGCDFSDANLKRTLLEEA